MIAWIIIGSILSVAWAQKCEGELKQPHSWPIIACLTVLFATTRVMPIPYHELFISVVIMVQAGVAFWLCWSLFAGHVTPQVFKTYYPRPVDTWDKKDFAIVWAGWAALFVAFMCLWNALTVFTLDAFTKMGIVFAKLIIPATLAAAGIGFIYGFLRPKVKQS